MLHDNSWNNLLKDMIDVTPALGSIHPFVPKFLNVGNEFFLRSGLNFWLKVELQFMPNVLNWIEVRAFRRGPPPVDAMLFKKGLGMSRGVFGIIVLHKTMAKSCWWMESECPQQCCSTDQPALFPRKYRFSWHHSCWCQPDMNLKWVFRFGLSLCWFINLLITRVAKLLKRDGAFVRDDIIKCISRV